MKSEGRIREKLGVGGIFTMIFVLSLGILVFAITERPSLELEEEEIIQTVQEIPREEPLPRAQEPPPEPTVTEENNPSDNNLIYSLSIDSHVQEQSIGASGSDILSGYLMQSGRPTFTIVAAPQGGNAIHVSGRENGFDTLDIALFSANILDIRENEYLMTVSGTIESGTEVSVRGMDDPWRRIETVEAGEDGTFSIEVRISRRNLSVVYGGIRQFTERGFRVQPEEIVDFIVHEIEVIRL